MNLIEAWTTAKKGKEVYHHRHGSIIKSYDPADLIYFIYNMRSPGILAYDWEIAKTKRTLEETFYGGAFISPPSQVPVNTKVKVTWEWEE